MEGADRCSSYGVRVTRLQFAYSPTHRRPRQRLDITSPTGSVPAIALLHGHLTPALTCGRGASTSDRLHDGPQPTPRQRDYLEAEIVLSLLARKVEAIQLSGEPERRLNNTLRGLARLPIRVRPA